MIYSLEDAEPYLDEKFILSKINQYDIFKHYCTNFIDINKSFKSELRKDNNPDCRIYPTGLGNLRYIDFATRTNYNCFEYIKAKYNCSYKEAIRIIANDFGLIESTLKFDPSLAIGLVDLPKTVYMKRPTIIKVVNQPFNMIDYDYWDQYKIPLELLINYNISSAQYVIVTKGDKKFVITYKSNNPCYAYQFSREDKYYYKIYRPYGLKNEKFLFNGSAEDLEGFDQLNHVAETLVITKSMKDVLVLRTMGIDAISLQGEANKLSKNTYTKLYNRFGRIISLYDNDETGIKGATYLYNTYKIKPIFVPSEYNVKDISDFIKNYGQEESKQLIHDLIE